MNREPVRHDEARNPDRKDDEASTPVSIGNILILLGLSVAAAAILVAIMGFAVGIFNFSDFLKGSVTSEQIKGEVNHITNGLAVSFYSMLIGIPLGVILAAIGVAVRKNAIMSRPPPVPKIWSNPK
jgi:ABC-type phosphate transport system permease subunit